MRGLLIAPTFQYKSKRPNFLSLSDFPSGFAYIASALEEAGHEVHGLNPNNHREYVDQAFMLQDIIPKKIREVEPEFIGLGGICTDYASIRDAIAIIRRENSNIPIVLGGQIVTNDTEDIVNILEPDYAIWGEAEDAMVKLVNDLENNIKVPKVIKPSTDTYRPLDDLPFPNYEPFGVRDMLDNYSMHTRLLYRYTRPYPRPFNIVASRSCPFSCTFCIHGHDRPKYRARSIENVMEEIKITYEKYQFNILILLDELFAVNKKRMKEFSEAVIEGKKQYGWGFDWMFQTHASARFDLESLKLAKEAGCFLFTYGLESASPRVLKSMNKKTKIEQIIEAMNLAREAKIGFGGNLIFGDIAETKKTIAESLSFWLQHCQDCFVFMVHLSPYPGSKLFNDLQERGMFQDKKAYYETIDDGLTNMTQMPQQDFAEIMGMIKAIGESWLFVEPVTNVRYEEESSNLVKVWGTCPYCKEESMYRTETPNPNQPFWLGIGCVHCNRKVRVGPE